MIGNPTRPGDLALAIRGVSVGAICEVIDVLPPDDKGCDRLVRVLNQCVGFNYSSDDLEALAPGENAVGRDAYLQPIRPPAPEEPTETEDHLVGVI